MTKVEKAFKKIKSDLTEHGLAFEADEFGLTIWKSGFTVLTQNCTIEIRKNEITVNEKPTELDDVIWDVLAIEQPNLLAVGGSE